MRTYCLSRNDSFELLSQTSDITLDLFLDIFFFNFCHQILICCWTTDGKFNSREMYLRCSHGHTLCVTFPYVQCSLALFCLTPLWKGFILPETPPSHSPSLSLLLSLLCCISFSPSPSVNSVHCNKEKTHHSTAFNTSVRSLPTSRCVCLLSLLCPGACILYFSQCVIGR